MTELAYPESQLEDDAVVLRRFTMDDAEAVAAACADPEIPEWTSVPRNYTIEHAREWLEGATERTDALHFAVVERESGAVTGALSLWLVRRGVGELGYWTGREHRGRGYMTRALRLVSTWALDELGLARLQLGTFPGNRSSERVAEKVGFRREGVLRAYFDQRGEQRRDVTMWSLLPGELEPSGAG